MNRDQEIDINDFKPNQYIVTIDLPGVNGESDQDSVNISRSNFLLRKIMHRVIGQEEVETEDFSIDASIDNQVKFFKGNQPPMATTFGSTKHGVWQEFVPPIPLNAQQSLYVELTNRYSVTQQRARTIQITFVGLEDQRPARVRDK